MILYLALILSFITSAASPETNYQSEIKIYQAHKNQPSEQWLGDLIEFLQEKDISIAEYIGQAVYFHDQLSADACAIVIHMLMAEADFIHLYRLSHLLIYSFPTLLKQEQINNLITLLEKCKTRKDVSETHREIYNYAYSRLRTLEQIITDREISNCDPSDTKPWLAPHWNSNAWTTALQAAPAPAQSAPAQATPASQSNNITHRYFGENPFAPDSWVE